jgi:hypothetical protein
MPSDELRRKWPNEEDLKKYQEELMQTHGATVYNCDLCDCPSFHGYGYNCLRPSCNHSCEDHNGMC